MAMMVMVRLTGLPLSCHVRVDTDPGTLPQPIQREREKGERSGLMATVAVWRGMVVQCGLTDVRLSIRSTSVPSASGPCPSASMSCPRSTS